jgi:hypothetical protein
VVISQQWAAIGALLPLVGFASYVQATATGRVQPALASWALWAAAPLIAFAAELAAHVPFRDTLVTLALGTGPLLVLTAALATPGATWKATRLDAACGALAVLALALWAATRHGEAAVALSIITDGLAAVPTVRKSWSDPGSESLWTYLASGAGAGITLLALPHWAFTAWGFQVYVVAVCAVITVLLARPRRRSTQALVAPGPPRRCLTGVAVACVLVLLAMKMRKGPARLPWRGFLLRNSSSS